MYVSGVKEIAESQGFRLAMSSARQAFGDHCTSLLVKLPALAYRATQEHSPRLI